MGRHGTLWQAKDTHPTKLSYRSMKFKAALQEDFALEVLKSVFV